MTEFTKDLIKSALVGVVIAVVVIIGILGFQNYKQIADLQLRLKSSEKITDYNLSGVENKLNDRLDDLEKSINDVPKNIKIDKIKLEQKLKQVNIMVRNKTASALGSGVSIKYKDNFYVLTAGHMAENDTDELYLYENDVEICKLEIVKKDYQGGEISENSNDLLLLRPINKNIQPKFYTEIADIEPITGTEIYVVGNPMGIEDVITDGRNIIYQGNFMYVIAPAYFGNSGGGIYNYEGKLVGIMSHIANLKPAEGLPDYVIAGTVRLETIKKFLKDVI